MTKARLTNFEGDIYETEIKHVAAIIQCDVVLSYPYMVVTRIFDFQRMEGPIAIYQETMTYDVIRTRERITDEQREDSRRQSSSVLPSYVLQPIN